MMEHRGRNIAFQLAAWQKRARLSDAAAAHELQITPLLFGLWKSGTPCPFPALVENRIGVPVQQVNRTPGGIIRR